MTDAEMIAEFLARKGATCVAEGARAMTSHDMRNAVRGDHTTPDNARIHVVIDHAGREFYHNDEGEWL